jgi:glucose-6-phosphate 1-epimerase
MPSAIELSRFNGLDAVELHAPDGARATVLLHGGHVVSWIPADADEQLYLSPKSGFAPGQAIRGGVPVIFPQFNARGPLQRHGFARNKVWQLVSARQETEEAFAVLRLSDDAETRASWPHCFNLELRVSVRAGTLDIALSCQNRGDTALAFTAALHTYLRVDALAATGLHGLAGLQYWDAVAATTQPQQDEWLAPAGDLDRVYYQVDRDLLLTESRDSGERRLQIHQQGFSDAVVWNPGAEKCAALKDMPADGYLNMLCVEAAAIALPIDLVPGERWTGLQKLDWLGR